MSLCWQKSAATGWANGCWERLCSIPNCKDCGAGYWRRATHTSYTGSMVFKNWSGLTVGWNDFTSQRSPSRSKKLVLPSRAMIEQGEIIGKIVVRRAVLAEVETLVELAARTFYDAFAA